MQNQQTAFFSVIWLFQLFGAGGKQSAICVVATVNLKINIEV
jgi:hypothetical protein